MLQDAEVIPRNFNSSPVNVYLSMGESGNSTLLHDSLILVCLRLSPLTLTHCSTFDFSFGIR